MPESDSALLALRRSGHRLTPQRSMVLNAIRELGGHVTVEAIYQRVQGRSLRIDLATVYRTTNLLKRLHLVNEVTVDGISRYEIASPDDRHHHMVCEHCGEAFHLAPQYLDALREQLLRDVGFEPHMEHFAISGLCSACRSDEEHAHSHNHLHKQEHTH